jgi:tetratricopeptide (TPR) repeat protein/transglutaminase-like putative cysteine protease
MTRQQQPRLRLISAALALSAILGLTNSAHGAAPPATSFTVATDKVLTIRPDFSSEKVITMRVKLLGEAALAQTGQQSLNFHESHQKLEVLEAYTEKEDGRRIDVEPAKIFTRDAASGAALMLQRDFKSTTIVFPDIAVGDSIVFTYRLTTHSGVLGRHVDDGEIFPRYMPYAKSTIRVVVPKSAALKIAVIGDGLAHTTMESPETVTHVVSYTPPPRVGIEAGETSLLDRDPRVIVSTFKDYEDLGRSWVAMADSRLRVTPEIQALADQITAGITDRRAQAEAIDRWVKRNIRYVALYLDAAAGWIPHEPNEIVRLRYGDCKDHTTLMGALLAAKGIASEAVVINAGNVYTLPQVAVRGYFNHMIIYLPEFGLYDDPTVATAAFGVLGQGDYDKPVLRMSANGVRLDHTPSMRPQEHVSKNETKITVAADGTMTGETKETGTGVFGAGLRGMIANIQHNGAEKSAETQLKTHGWTGNGRFVLPRTLDLADPFALTGEFKLATAAGRDVPFPVGLMTRVRPGNYLLGPRFEGRKHPFVCLAGGQIEEIELTFAPGLTLPGVPQGRTIENSRFSYMAQYRLEGRTLKVRREFVSKVAGQVCAAEVEAEVAGALKAVVADLNTRIRMPAAAGAPVATNERPPAGPQSPNPSDGAHAQPTPAPASQAANRARCAGSDNAPVDQRVAACTAVIQAGEETPQSLALAFSNRGHAYRIKGDYARALQDFNEAIRRVPNLATAFNGRGLTWGAMQDYERAIADFNEAIGHAPTFAVALVNRANVYRTAGRTEQAMHDYDEALRLDPTLVFAYLSRGRAHRIAGNAERALADFDDAIRLKRDNAFAWAERCYTQAVANENHKALESCNEALKLKPSDAYALANRGFVLLKLAEFDRAIADFDKVVSVYPRDARALYGRGYAKAKKGDAEGANLDMAVARSIKPDVGQEFVKLDPTVATTEGRSS